MFSKVTSVTQKTNERKKKSKRDGRLRFPWQKAIHVKKKVKKKKHTKYWQFQRVFRLGRVRVPPTMTSCDAGLVPPLRARARASPAASAAPLADIFTSDSPCFFLSGAAQETVARGEQRAQHRGIPRLSALFRVMYV